MNRPLLILLTILSFSALGFASSSDRYYSYHYATKHHRKHSSHHRKSSHQKNSHPEHSLKHTSQENHKTSTSGHTLGSTHKENTSVPAETSDPSLPSSKNENGNGSSNSAPTSTPAPVDNNPIAGTPSDIPTSPLLPEPPANQDPANQNPTEPSSVNDFVNPLFLTVDHPYNQPDRSYISSSSTFGSVPYVFNIAAYDVTAEDYAMFLNAVASKGDPQSLYNEAMGSDPASASIICTTTSTESSYSPIPGREKFPIVFVSLFSAARYCNWLQNGQPLGDEGPTTTETGSYDLTQVETTGLVRTEGATYFLPTENEWYKAAYFNPKNSSYYTFPNRSYWMPHNTHNLTTPYNNEANYDGYLTGDKDVRLTPVGTFSTSMSPCGAFDMGGDVAQWTETQADPKNATYILRGGSWASCYQLELIDLQHSDLESSVAQQARATARTNTIGFRIVKMEKDDDLLPALSATPDANWLTPNEIGGGAAALALVASPLIARYVYSPSGEAVTNKGVVPLSPESHKINYVKTAELTPSQTSNNIDYTDTNYKDASSRDITPMTNPMTGKVPNSTTGNHNQQVVQPTGTDLNDEFSDNTANATATTIRPFQSPQDTPKEPVITPKSHSSESDRSLTPSTGDKKLRSYRSAPNLKSPAITPDASVGSDKSNKAVIGAPVKPFNPDARPPFSTSLKRKKSAGVISTSPPTDNSNSVKNNKAKPSEGDNPGPDEKLKKLVSRYTRTPQNPLKKSTSSRNSNDSTTGLVGTKKRLEELGSKKPLDSKKTPQPGPMSEGESCSVRTDQTNGYTTDSAQDDTTGSAQDEY